MSGEGELPLFGVELPLDGAASAAEGSVGGERLALVGVKHPLPAMDGTCARPLNPSRSNHTLCLPLIIQRFGNFDYALIDPRLVKCIFSLYKASNIINSFTPLV